MYINYYYIHTINIIKICDKCDKPNKFLTTIWQIIIIYIFTHHLGCCSAYSGGGRVLFWTSQRVSWVPAKVTWLRCANTNINQPHRSTQPQQYNHNNHCNNNNNHRNHHNERSDKEDHFNGDGRAAGTDKWGLETRHVSSPRYVFYFFIFNFAILMLF